MWNLSAEVGPDKNYISFDNDNELFDDRNIQNGIERISPTPYKIKNIETKVAQYWITKNNNRQLRYNIMENNTLRRIHYRQQIQFHPAHYQHQTWRYKEDQNAKRITA